MDTDEGKYAARLLYDTSNGYLYILMDIDYIVSEISKDGWFCKI